MPKPMNNNNNEVFKQGYMTERTVLDPLAMRPYLNAQGVPVISVLAGFKVVKNEKSGRMEQKPIYKQQRVFKNALLRLRDWEQIDAEVRDVMRQPLPGYDDLRAAGLTQPLDGLGVSLSTYDQIGDMSPASVSMSITPWKSEKDRVVFAGVSIPVPVITKPFMLDIRTLDASRRNGREGLDTTQTRVATQKVRETIEEMIFNGSDIQLQSYKIYGYANHPNRVADTAANFGGGDFATDGNAHKTLSGMVAALIAKGFTGPFGAYISATQYAQTLNLTGANLSETQLSVVQRTIPDLKFVKRAPKLSSTTGEVVLVQLTKDVVDLAIGQDIAPISWQEFGGLLNEFMVIAAMVPRIKGDIDGNVGIAHATAA